MIAIVDVFGILNGRSLRLFAANETLSVLSVRMAPMKTNVRRIHRATPTPTV